MGWEVLEGVVTIYTLYLMLKHVYQSRKRLWKGIKWLSVKTFGVSVSLLGGAMLGVLPMSLWSFPRGPFQSVTELAGFTIGLGIGVWLWASVGTVLVSAGIWAIAPKSSVAARVRREIFRRSDNSARKEPRTTAGWIGTRRRMPAASTHSGIGPSLG